MLERQERRSWHEIVTLDESFGRIRMQRFLKTSGTLSNPKSDAHHSLESWWFLLGQYPARRLQIQWELLWNSDY
jgi:hypothetical protein